MASMLAVAARLSHVPAKVRKREIFNALEKDLQWGLFIGSLFGGLLGSVITAAVMAL